MSTASISLASVRRTHRTLVGALGEVKSQPDIVIISIMKWSSVSTIMGNTYNVIEQIAGVMDTRCDCLMPARAEYGNRTRLSGLGSPCTTDMLIPQEET